MQHDSMDILVIVYVDLRLHVGLVLSVLRLVATGTIIIIIIIGNIGF